MGLEEVFVRVRVRVQGGFRLRVKRGPELTGWGVVIVGGSVAVMPQG